MEFRRWTSADIEAVTEFAIVGLRPALYPGHLDVNKVRTAVRHFCYSASDWHLAAFDGGKVVGICAVQVTEQPWFERSQGTVVALFATAPGAGWKLLRELFRWYAEQPMLRRLYWPLEFDAEPRMMRIAERFGFNSFNVVAAHHKV